MELFLSDILTVTEQHMFVIGLELGKFTQAALGYPMSILGREFDLASPPTAENPNISPRFSAEQQQHLNFRLMQQDCIILTSKHL